MAYNIKVKNGIAFNLDDPFQLEMYEHISKIPNVSAYLKRLIAIDMTGNWVFTNSVSKNQDEIEIVQADEDKMLQFI